MIARAAQAAFGVAVVAYLTVAIGGALVLLWIPLPKEPPAE